MNGSRMSRREMLETCIVKGTLVAGLAAVPGASLLAQYQAQESGNPRPTGREDFGPFYKKGAPNVRLLRRPTDAGFPLRVTGRVMNMRGDALPNAAVDLWHADFYGLYDLEGFQFRTRILTDSAGTYVVETIMPGHYQATPAQHIHYFVNLPGHEPLVTQAYFATDPVFEGDPGKNFARVTANRENVRPVTLHSGADGGYAEILFDLVLAEA